MEGWRDTEFLIPKQVGSILGISLGMAYNAIHGLPHIRIGRLVKIRTVVFQKYMKDNERKAKQ